MLTVLMSCAGREYEYSYYANGQLKERAELKDGVHHGEFLTYYEDGTIKSKEQWKEGQAHGVWESYYPSGIISKLLIVQNDTAISMTTYDESGLIFEVQRYDSLGEILFVDRFNEDGSRFKHCFPVFFPHDGDTFVLGDESFLRGRIVNITDSVYFEGRLFITTAFDTLNGGVLQDTLAIIDPLNGIDYYYYFVPNRLGENHIHGEFLFITDYDSTFVRTRNRFSYSFIVVDQN